MVSQTEILGVMAVGETLSREQILDRLPGDLKLTELSTPPVAATCLGSVSLGRRWRVPPRRENLGLSEAVVNSPPVIVNTVLLV